MNDQSNFLPHSIEAEQGLLGAVLLNNDAFFAVSEIVEAEHFYEPLHQRLWALFDEQIAGGHIVSPITIAGMLGVDATFDVGGMSVKQYIARLASEATTILHAPDFAITIRSTWGRRYAIGMARDTLDRAIRGQDDESIDDILNDVDKAVESIRFGKHVSTIKWLGDSAAVALKNTAEAYENDRIPGFDTGIKGLDEAIGRILPGNHLTMIAPSGTGKTALAMQILERISEPSLDASRGQPSLLISMEMKGEELSRRSIAGETGISTEKQATGAVLAADYDRLKSAADGLQGVKVLIDDAGPQTGTQIEKKIRAMHKRHNIGFAAIDHMRLYVPENPRWTTVETIEKNAIRFQKLAKELNIPIMQLAQLKADAQTHHWRITISDIYGGGMVRQCSDIVFAVVRPTLWLKEREPDANTKEWDKWQSDLARWEGKAEASALKIRSGESGARRVIEFDGPKVKFF